MENTATKSRVNQTGRVAFTTSRALESFSESELTTQIGYRRELWPLVLVKEQGDTNSAEDNILIPLATAKDIAFSGYDFILGLVDRLPENAAAQCNPENPQLAFAVLKSEWTYILCNAFDAYAAWSKVGPHISTAANAE